MVKIVGEYIEYPEQSSAPSTPASANIREWWDNTATPRKHHKADDGVDRTVLDTHMVRTGTAIVDMNGFTSKTATITATWVTSGSKLLVSIAGDGSGSDYDTGTALSDGLTVGAGAVVASTSFDIELRLPSTGAGTYAVNWMVILA